MNLLTISKEDLLLKITKVKAENSSIKVQLGKDQAYIQELEDRLIKQEQRINESFHGEIEKLKEQLEKCREKNRNQKNAIYHLNEKIKALNH